MANYTALAQQANCTRTGRDFGERLAARNRAAAAPDAQQHDPQESFDRFGARLERGARLFARLRAPLLVPPSDFGQWWDHCMADGRFQRARLTSDAEFLSRVKRRFWPRSAPGKRGRAPASESGKGRPWQRKWASAAEDFFRDYRAEDWLTETETLNAEWVVLRDLNSVAPPGGEDDCERYARDDYRKTLHPWLRDQEMVLNVAPGQPVEIVIRCDHEQLLRWCAKVDGGARYTAIGYEGPEQLWRPAGVLVHLSPAGAAGTTQVHEPHTALLAPREPVASDAVLATRIPELDALYVSGGLPAGECRMVVTAETRVGKTSYLVDQADAYEKQGAEVVIATTSGEDSAAELMVRRLQRLGCPRATAIVAVKGQPEGAAWAARGARELSPNIRVVTDVLVDQLILVDSAAALAAGRPFVLMVDTVQRAKSTNSVGREGRLAVDAVLADLAAAQGKRPCLIVVAAHVSRIAAIEVARGRLNPLHSAKESGGVETWAKSFLYLSAGKEKGTIRFRLAKNKDGEEGDFEVTHDRATQSFGVGSMAALAARHAEREAAILADVTRTLGEKGPLSARKLRVWVKANEGAIRAVLSSAVDAGTLVLEGTAYRIP